LVRFHQLVESVFFLSHLNLEIEEIRVRYPYTIVEYTAIECIVYPISHLF